jgi:general secretion pathway protein C
VQTLATQPLRPAPRPFSAGRVALSAVIALLLLLALGGRLLVAVRDWQPAAPPSVVASGEQPGPQTVTVNLAAVQALQLFAGSTAADPARQLPVLASTELNLSLEGVVIASDAANSVAVLVSNGQQQSYRVGATLPIGVAVSLVRVAQDHVILDNNGIEQALWLYADNKSKPSAGAGDQRTATASTATATLANALNSGPAAAPQQIQKAAARLAEIIEVAPALANGALVGYQLSPGYRLKEFVQLGFKTNDIVTAVNGVALNDMANLSQLYGLMNQAGDVSFSVLRDGQPVTLQMTMAP